MDAGTDRGTGTDVVVVDAAAAVEMFTAGTALAADGPSKFHTARICSPIATSMIRNAGR